MEHNVGGTNEVCHPDAGNNRGSSRTGGIRRVNCAPCLHPAATGSDRVPLRLTLAVFNFLWIADVASFHFIFLRSSCGEDWLRLSASQLFRVGIFLLLSRDWLCPRCVSSSRQ